MFFRKSVSYNRAVCIEAAGAASARGRLKTAISEYKKILDADPSDQAVHMKIAPLLAKARSFPDAWRSFKAAAQNYEKNGFYNKAAGVYTHAAKCMPRESAVWEALSGLYLSQGRKADAVGALMNGYPHFRGRRYREKGIKLLRSACEIMPWSYEPTYALARLLAKTGRKEEAVALFEGLAARKTGDKRRKAFGAAFRTSPGLGYAWKWAKAAAGK